MQTYTNTDKIKFDKIIKAKTQPGMYDKIYLDKTNKYINFIKWIPGILFIGVGNSISMNTGNKESDIDLFIITKSNRMWFVRIITTFIFQILGVRKTAKKHAGKFCLSFFATTDGMDFSNFALEKDIYLYFWIVYLKPILDYNNTYDKFIKSQSWADFKEFNDKIQKNKKSIIYKKTTKENSKLINKIDDLFKNIFINKSLKNYEKLGKPYGIIINDDILKFHNNDIRKIFEY